MLKDGSPDMVNRVRAPNALQWKQSRSRRGTGWKILSYNDSTGRYRVNQYLKVGDLPFFALIAAMGNSRCEQISRHGTLDEAKAACEQHLRQSRG